MHLLLFEHVLDNQLVNDNFIQDITEIGENIKELVLYDEFKRWFRLALFLSSLSFLL
jgi:hypothetical protein